MALDPRLIFGLDTQAPARTGAALGVMNDRIPALKLAMGLQELQNQQAYRQAQLEEQKQQTALRQKEYAAATTDRERKEAERKAGAVIPFVSMMAQNPTEEGLSIVTQRMAAHPDIGPEGAAKFAQTYKQYPVAQWATLSRMEAAGTPEGQRQSMQASFPEPGKDTGQWSEPYQLGGATVQKNSKTGEIRTAVSRPPVTHISSDAGNFTNVQPDGRGGWTGLNKKTGRMEQIPQAQGVQGAGQLDEDAINQAAARYRIDGTLPPNLGRGTQGSINTGLILKRAAEQSKEAGDSPESTRLNQIANKASAQALGQLVKQKNLILAFEKNAVANADIVLNESEKVGRFGVPIVDRWIQAGKKEIGGDAEVARLDAAIRTFVNEYARVTTSVTGGGITSDTARREIETLLRGAHTKEQVRQVVSLMKQEMENRRIGYEQQEAELKGGIRASPNAPATPAASSAPAAKPAVVDFGSLK